MTGLRLRIRGVVQGVGFRPFVYRLARELGLTGRVLNSTREVVVEVWGEPRLLERLTERLRSELPPVASILELLEEPLAGQPPADFTIQASARTGGDVSLIPPDLATCPDCLREIRDPSDRRHGYPFTSCTYCGPRFTIVQEVPYDRPRTTMAGFELCPDCRGEYEDPRDRRFHAQPNACPVCGPRLRLLDREGRLRTGDPLAEASRALDRDEVLALKGLGGFHLAVRADSSEAVLRLRARKRRPTKPFAVMVADLEQARRLCRLTPEEEALLSSPNAPIVLLPRRVLPEEPLAPEVAPGMAHLGLFLPTTPLHHLLLGLRPERPLVMTSGNPGGRPILIEAEEVVRELPGTADLLLDHDRPIHNRCDDSVAQVVAGRTVLHRRARGFAPLPVELGEPGPTVLAIGADLKSTFCLARGERAYLSQHLGEQGDLATLDFLTESVEKFRRWLETEPEAVACDAHPDYLSSRLAEELSSRLGLPLHRIQHHHAHAAAALAESKLAGPALALSFDGTGYGADGTVWGGELLTVRREGWRRLGGLEPFLLPGGDRAAREGWRVALSLCHELGMEEQDLPEPLRRGVSEPARRFVLRQIESRENSPDCSSMGRLFDAAAAVAGCCLESTYEGEAAMRWEALAHQEAQRLDRPHILYQYRLSSRGGLRRIETAGLLRALMEDLSQGTDPELAAARFHETVAAAGVALAEWAREETGLGRLILTGGVFQNRILLRRTAELAREAGLEPILPGLVPPNDGGIALGQAAAVRWGSRLEPEE